MKKSYDLRKISRAAGARQDEGIRQIKKGGHRSRSCARACGAKKKLTVTFRSVCVLWEVSSLAAHDERACHNG